MYLMGEYLRKCHGLEYLSFTGIRRLDELFDGGGPQKLDKVLSYMSDS